MGKVVKIVNASKRTGEKNGKKWNIMSVEVDDNGMTVVADTFDNVEVGSVVTLTKNEYGYSAKLNKGNFGQGQVLIDMLTTIDKKLDDILKSVGQVDENTPDWS